jgi:hypothetical protein
LNRATAFLGANKLDPARKDYLALQDAYNAPPEELDDQQVAQLKRLGYSIFYGLGEIAWRSKDTNAALGYYQQYLDLGNTNSAEARFVSDRLKQLKPGSP